MPRLGAHDACCAGIAKAHAAAARHLCTRLVACMCGPHGIARQHRMARASKIGTHHACVEAAALNHAAAHARQKSIARTSCLATSGIGVNSRINACASSCARPLARLASRIIIGDKRIILRASHIGIIAHIFGAMPWRWRYLLRHWHLRVSVARKRSAPYFARFRASRCHRAWHRGIISRACAHLCAARSSFCSYRACARQIIT